MEQVKLNPLKITLRIVTGMLFYAVLVFLPAGGLGYRQGWLFIGSLVLYMLTAVPYLYWRHPNTLLRRLRDQEKQPQQQCIIRFMATIAISGIVLCGFDYRLGWSDLSLTISLYATVFLMLSLLGILWVMITNEYAGRTIEVEQGQQVISTGPYAVVRHPMYAFCLILFVAVPMVLGSLWVALFNSIAFPIVFYYRMVNEEQLLKRELKGYKDYCKNTRYRIIPFVW